MSIGVPCRFQSHAPPVKVQHKTVVVGHVICLSFAISRKRPATVRGVVFPTDPTTTKVTYYDTQEYRCDQGIQKFQDARLAICRKKDAPVNVKMDSQHAALRQEQQCQQPSRLFSYIFFISFVVTLEPTFCALYPFYPFPMLLGGIRRSKEE